MGGRRKIWQLEAPFHCSVIGTCLTLKELRDLRKKLRIEVPAALSDYELHRCFVSAVAAANHVARRINKYLDRKYRTAIQRFARAADDEALTALWGQALDSGELAGAYWALVTHPGASSGLIDRVYGEVHMLSHLAGAAVRVDMQELTRLKRANKDLDGQLSEARSRARQQMLERDATIEQMQQRLERAHADLGELYELRERLAALQSQPLALTLRKQVEDYAGKLSEARLRAEHAEAALERARGALADNNDRLRDVYEQLAQVQAERDSLEGALDRLIGHECDSCEVRDECREDINLCGRCILYVGGRSRQCASFRSLVERHNGRFIHHDGGLDDSKLRLKSILSQADAVFCPLDSVSHDAARRVKHHCKRYGKRLVFLPQSSLAAFTRGLSEVAA